jgi:nucleoside-diphosphate-sugar epimerase
LGSFDQGDWEGIQLLGTILITGVSGYLGVKVANRLIDNGHTVIGVDIHKNAELSDKVQFYKADVRSKDQIRKAFSDKIETVIHAAALVPITKMYNDYKSVNVEGTQAVAEVSLEFQVRSFIQISSSSVYRATSDAPMEPNFGLNPIEPYGKSKLKAELIARKVLKGSEVSLAIVRPRTIIGPDRGGIFELFFSWISEGKPIFTIGKGDKPFQFVHVEDLVAAILLIAQNSASGVFNVGTDRYGTLKSVFQELILHAGSKSRVFALPKGLTIGALFALELIRLSPLTSWHYRTLPRAFHFNIAPMKKLSWSPKYSNDEMLIEAYESYLARGGKMEHVEGASPHSRPIQGGILSWIQKMF